MARIAASLTVGQSRPEVPPADRRRPDASTSRSRHRCGPEEVVIPASMGRESGMWVLIETGLRGVVVPGNTPVVYVLFQPATNYYRNKTGQSPLMPVLVNQTI